MIKRRTGGRICLWFYYLFCHDYGRAPEDLDDLCDGLKMMGIRGEVGEIYRET